jgi:hypothetical protein
LVWSSTALDFDETEDGARFAGVGKLVIDTDRRTELDDFKFEREAG